MDCREFNEKYLLHMFGELGPEKAGGFEKHMQECPACRAVYEDARLAVDAVQKTGTPSLDPTSAELMKRRVARAAANPGQETVRRSGFARTALVAAAVMLFVATAVFSLNQGTETGSTATLASTGSKASSTDYVGFQIPEIPGLDNATTAVRTAEYTSWVLSKWTDEDASFMSAGEDGGIIDREIEKLDTLISSLDY